MTPDAFESIWKELCWSGLLVAPGHMGPVHFLKWDQIIQYACAGS